MTEKEQAYKELIKQTDALIYEGEPHVTALSNFAALFFHSLDYVSWCGFYLLFEGRLILGPFQGKVACEFIEIGKGVCGTSAEKRVTIIVENVHEFPGHIACDADSKSEIVVPLIVNENLYGVLDLDSYDFSAFNEIDKIYLEKAVANLLQKIDLGKLC